MKNVALYQAVFDRLRKYLIPGWEKIIVYLEYGEASYSFAFYIKKSEEYIKCYDIPNVSEKDLSITFSSINDIVSDERSHNTDMLWTSMTMTVDNDGKIKVDYDYTDLSEGTYQFKKKWKKKYLK